MLSREERLELAHTIRDRLVDALGDDVLLVGLYGSTARGTDTPWSDLEMLVVTREGAGLESRHLVYRGTAVGYTAIDEARLRGHLTVVSDRWPFWMGVLSELAVLHGDAGLVRGWLAMGEAVPVAEHRRVLRDMLPALVVESHGRMHSCLLRGEHADLYVSAVEVLLEMLTALCLLNGRWVAHDYSRGLCDAATFPSLPAGWAEDAPALWVERDPRRAVELADRLVAAYLGLLEREGLPLSDVRRPEDLEVVRPGCGATGPCEQERGTHVRA